MGCQGRDDVLGDSAWLQGRCVLDPFSPSPSFLDQVVHPDYQCPLRAGAGTTGERQAFGTWNLHREGMRVWSSVACFATDGERAQEDEGATEESGVGRWR